MLFVMMRERGYISIYTHPQAVFSANGTVHVGETILVHDPVCFLSLGRFSGVKHQRFFYPNRFRFTNRFICSGCFPVPGSRGPVRPRTVRVLPVPRWEEIPLFLSIQRHSCTQKEIFNHFTDKIIKYLNNSNFNIIFFLPGRSQGSYL